jgi:hypothetical protein
MEESEGMTAEEREAASRMLIIEEGEVDEVMAELENVDVRLNRITVLGLQKNKNVALFLGLSRVIKRAQMAIHRLEVRAKEAEARASDPEGAGRAEIEREIADWLDTVAGREKVTFVAKEIRGLAAEIRVGLHRDSGKEGQE